MASRAKQRRGEEKDCSSVVLRMCSINTTGVVLVTNRALDVSSELSLTIQTHLLGVCQDWLVEGWVIDCVLARLDQEALFQVTLLFSEIPQALRQLLALADLDKGPKAYPPVPEVEIFGLN